ncbi:MAG: hypothetical protein PVH63_03890 [Balneolaceae bacterium]|jgi:hypothetical protein
MASKRNMQVINATYKHWSHPPASGSDVPERGINLKITLQNWPEGYKPKYIVFERLESHSATVAKYEEDKVIITARIIRVSNKLTRTAKSTTLSDRLVFSDPDGNIGFIEIIDWQRAEL